ncbi:MAG: 50S ribosomal protein L11 methyltransferase [Pyrinomonadaceae bacterium]|nr:50S ribosomal protein L11 methyltransferase [Pyrinomonadaceae bacterium]MBP9109845.1 50S ribosomal protein L11 methyltransferase [Pyrinomonadaceae bacterium]
MRNWYAVDILAEYEASEAIESAFNELGALGTEIDGLRKKKDEPLMVTGFFDEVLDDETIRSSVDDSLAIYGFANDAVKNIAHRTVEETDWLAEWKKHWRPTTIGKFIIAPPWSEVDDPERIVIRVEPNMAFGTGTHETTQLCLKAISERYDASMSVLDVGTGTGILAIATAKLGGTNILACDTDLDSVKIARENAVLNDVGEEIEFFDGSIDAATPQFDFVCANLTIDVIVPILDLLLAKAKHTLLLSGILSEQEPKIREALQKFDISDSRFEIERSGEWISVIVTVSPVS